MVVRVRVLYPTLSLCLLASCAQSGPGRSPGFDVSARYEVSDDHRVMDAAYDGPHDFGWQLSGDREGAPLQVFSTPAGVWLQFANHDSPPAIFAQLADGREKLLPPRASPPYAFIPGNWRRLVFRAGAHIAYAAKADGAYAFAAVGPRGSLAQQAGDGARGNHVQYEGASAGNHPARYEAGSGAYMPAATNRGYGVRRSDGNLRRVLTRWAGLSGWTFDPEHWALDADIPISAEADLGDDFRSAFRGLMASTEMGDLPVQPCFYANKVLRVVAYSQHCDPRSAPGTPTHLAGVQ